MTKKSDTVAARALLQGEWGLFDVPPDCDWTYGIWGDNSRLRATKIDELAKQHEKFKLEKHWPSLRSSYGPPIPRNVIDCYSKMSEELRAYFVLKYDREPSDPLTAEQRRHEADLAGEMRDIESKYPEPKAEAEQQIRERLVALFRQLGCSFDRAGWRMVAQDLLALHAEGGHAGNLVTRLQSLQNNLSTSGYMRFFRNIAVVCLAKNEPAFRTGTKFPIRGIEGPAVLKNFLQSYLIDKLKIRFSEISENAACKKIAGTKYSGIKEWRRRNGLNNYETQLLIILALCNIKAKSRKSRKLPQFFCEFLHLRQVVALIESVSIELTASEESDENLELPFDNPYVESSIVQEADGALRIVDADSFVKGESIVVHARFTDGRLSVRADEPELDPTGLFSTKSGINTNMPVL